MKKLLYILIIFNSFAVHGQNFRIDSIIIKSLELNAKNNFGELFMSLSALREEYALINDTGNYVVITIRMADASRGGGSHLEALKILKELEESEFNISPQYQVGKCLVRGSVFYEISKHDSAIYWAKKGIDLSYQGVGENYRPLLYNLLGSGYITVNNDSAIKYFQISIDYFLSIKDSTGVVLPYLNMARLYMDKGENEEAIKRIKYSLSILDKKDTPIYRKMAYNYLAMLYIDKENYQIAVKYLSLRDSVNHEINNNEITFQIAQFQDELEKQKAQSDVLTLKARIELGQMKNRKDSIIMVFGLILVVVLSMFLFFTIKNNKRFKILNAQTIVRAKELEGLNKFKDKVLSVISHDMRAPLAQIITFHQARNSGINFSESEIREMDKTILASTQSGLLILDNLLKWARSNIDGMVLKIEPLNSFFVLTQILNQVHQLAVEKDIKIVTQLDKVEIETDEGLFQIIVRNLLSNAIKFSPPNSEVNVQSQQENNFLLVKVIDSGPGIPKRIIEALDSGEKINPKTGSFGEKGAGIGLSLSIEFAHKLGGSILFSNSENGGAITTLKVPLK